MFSRLRSRWRFSAADLIPALLAMGSLILFTDRESRSTGFWYDESVQYWISRGLDPMAPPLQPPGGIADVIKHNGLANLDPGGLSVLLHYWLKVDRSPAWQRLFPLLFFSSGLAAMGWLGWRWRRSLRFAVFSALAPAAFPMLLDYASEFRAYSMECAGVFWGCLLLDRLARNPRPANDLLAGAALALFLTSRYSYVCVAIAIAILAVGLILRDEPLPAARARRLACLLLPPLGAGIAVIWLGFLPQYRARITYDDGAMIAYLAGVKLPDAGLAAILAKAGWNLLHPATLLLILGPVAAYLARRRRPEAFAGVPERTWLPYALGGLVLAITVALWKWHPWDAGSKWSSYLQAVAAVILVRLAADGLALLDQGGPARLRRLAASACPVAGVALALILATHQRERIFDVAPALAYLNRNKPKFQQVAVEPHCYPTLRYFYDEGPFAGKTYYPRGFRLPFWGGPSPLISERTRYYIAFPKVTSLEKAFPHVLFEADPDLPPHLARVKGLRGESPASPP